MVKPFKGTRNDQNRSNDEEEDDANREWAIEDIDASECRDGKIYYHVKWIGYDQPSWEPLDSFTQTGGTYFIDKFETWKQTNRELYDQRMREHVIQLQLIEQELNRRQQELEAERRRLLQAAKTLDEEQKKIGNTIDNNRFQFQMTNLHV